MAQSRPPPVQRRQRTICPMPGRSYLFWPQMKHGWTQIDVALFSAQNRHVLKTKTTRNII
jgi:hypothetical protein